MLISEFQNAYIRMLKNSLVMIKTSVSGQANCMIRPSKNIINDLKMMFIHLNYMFCITDTTHFMFIWLGIALHLASALVRSTV